MRGLEIKVDKTTLTYRSQSPFGPRSLWAFLFSPRVNTSTSTVTNVRGGATDEWATLKNRYSALKAEKTLYMNWNKPFYLSLYFDGVERSLALDARGRSLLVMLTPSSLL